MKKYAFTPTFYFKLKLDEMYNNETSILDENIKQKIITQYELFNNEFKNIALEYEFKNLISMDYMIQRLVNLNKCYTDFTETPVQIDINQLKNEFIHESLVDKSYIKKCINKIKIDKFLFDKTCFKLGWFYN